MHGSAKNAFMSLKQDVHFICFQFPSILSKVMRNLFDSDFKADRSVWYESNMSTLCVSGDFT